MDTLLDYIQWMGDFPLSATGFREADALVLCMLSYYDLSPVFDGAEGDVYVRDCLRLLRDDQFRVLVAGKDTAYARFLELAASSRRFGDLRMSDYVDVLLDDPPLQFAAVCFHGEHGCSFLAYRGTDNSLVGGEEDFMISFTRTRAQAQALAYAETHITPDRRWYMGGHTKGGNLVLYAANSLSEAKWRVVQRAFILDGPGLCPEVMDLTAMERIDAKATHIVPRFSVVGKLFAPQITDTRIIQSGASGFMQHSLITWGIDHGKLALADAHDPTSLWINATVDGWLDGISQADRVALVKDLFDALSAGGAQSLDALDEGGVEGLNAILRRLKDSSEVTRKSFADLPRQAWKQALLNLRRKPKEEKAEREEPSATV